MNNYKELIEQLERYGLTNGTSLGRHMGIMDEAASALTTLTEEVDKLRVELESYRALGPIDHLRELVQADQDGQLMVLPCSMEDPVYVIAKCKDVVLYQERDTGAVDCPFEEDCPFDACEDDQVHVFKTTIPGFIYNEDRDSELKLFLDNIKFDFSKKDIGKTVFLTREEAEAALSAGRNQNTQEDQP